MDVEFKPWPKIPRYKGLNVTITEKIDGTNGCLIVSEGRLVGVQSRNIMLAFPNDDGVLQRNSDNYGFAYWAVHRHDVLSSVLGDGYHYGEWAGPGIQGNPLKLEKKTFFLFNVHRWQNLETIRGPELATVPLLYKGKWEDVQLDGIMSDLWQCRNNLNQTPEGVIVYFDDLRTSMKYTFEHQEGKWASAS